MALARTDSRNDSGEQKNRMDKENAAFYERVRQSYLQIADREPERFRIVDANGSTSEIQTRIVEIVTNFLSENANA